MKDLFNKKGIEGIVNTVVEQMDIIPENITGHWEYAGTAVKFTGDNMLMNAASELASGQVEEKLDEYLQIIGLKEGVFGYTFNADSTFTTTFNKMEFHGKYTFSPEEDTIELNYGKTGKLKGVSMKTMVSVTPASMQLLFNADKLLEFIGKISSSVGDARLGTLSSLVEQYDGMKIGFELTRKKRIDILPVITEYHGDAGDYHSDCRRIGCRPAFRNSRIRRQHDSASCHHILLWH